MSLAEPAVPGVFVAEGSDGQPHLLLSSCDCGATAFPPRSRCQVCGKPVERTIEAPANGAVYSWTTQPGTKPPRVVALVKLDGGPTVQGFIDADAADVRIGQAVRTVVVPFPSSAEGSEFSSYAFAPVEVTP
jgi:uncharacterized OB-fold protein